MPTPLEFTVSDAQQELLNPPGINVIRDFRADGRGVRVWAARTVSTDSQWRNVNVRRLLNYIRESIDKGSQWVVFEPNDEPPWARVRQAVTNFQTATWRAGAFQGSKPEEAFFVHCGPESVTPDDIDAGSLICAVGAAPVRPAEFIVFTIRHEVGESDTG